MSETLSADALRRLSAVESRLGAVEQQQLDFAEAVNVRLGDMAKREQSVYNLLSTDVREARREASAAHAASSAVETMFRADQLARIPRQRRQDWRDLGLALLLVLVAIVGVAIIVLLVRLLGALLP